MTEKCPSWFLGDEPAREKQFYLFSLKKHLCPCIGAPKTWEFLFETISVLLYETYGYTDTGYGTYLTPFSTSQSLFSKIQEGYLTILNHLHVSRSSLPGYSSPLIFFFFIFQALIFVSLNPLIFLFFFNPSFLSFLFL